MTQTIYINKDKVNAVDLSPMVQYIEWSENKQYFQLEAGKEHYKLLSYITSQLHKSPKKYIDIGTYYGFSAAAMAMNTDAEVISYDVCDWIPDNQYTIKNCYNVDLRIMNCLNDIDTLLQTDFICLDIAHDTITEQEILTTLQHHQYKGLLFLDDIKYSQKMFDWWNSIELPKYDLSDVGHWSGSGLVVFDTSKFNVVVE